MHGIVNRSLQSFLTDTYGREVWVEIARDAGIGVTDVEPFLDYAHRVTPDILAAAAARLSKSQTVILEDFGTYLVSHPNMHRLRRLLRFGGDGFVDFLHSLNDLHDRSRLALPDLDVPRLDLHQVGEGRYRLRMGASHALYVPLAMGVLRAMADDYGALAFLDAPEIAEDGDIRVDIAVLSTSFAPSRGFDLSLRRV
ncbi:heme NO-binding protein [Rhodobacteraceae bacterium CCMM004]|nr:heme NO-binding protein [Rhodobacteraceae bacterium CCMM004]